MKQHHATLLSNLTRGYHRTWGGLTSCSPSAVWSAVDRYTTQESYSTHNLCTGYLHRISPCGVCIRSMTYSLCVVSRASASQTRLASWFQRCGTLYDVLVILLIGSHRNGQSLSFVLKVASNSASHVRSSQSKTQLEGMWGG